MYVVLSILLSILVCSAAGIFCAWLVIVYVCAPCVIAGSTHGLYTCFVGQIANFLLKRSRCLDICRPSNLPCSPLYLFVLALFLLAVVLTPGRPKRRLQHFLPPPCSRCFGYRISSFRRYSSDKFAYFVRIVLVATVVIRVVVKCTRICHQQNIVEKLSVYLHALVLPICQKKSKHIP